ncbi:MAG: GNAT family N-acetyltransferase [Clostridia bacterium]|nr:GNAT family N-acetyltransferase [Clostridia bacterium]
MRELDKSDVSQFNALLRYAFQVTSRELMDVGWEEDEIRRSKYPVIEKANVLGWFDQDKLASQLAVYPMKVNIHGEIYSMGGVTGVATYPEYANAGLMHSLMKKSLEDMKARGQSISFLCPYSIPYYRKKGWEIVSDKMTFSIKDTQLPKRVEVPGMVERVDLEHDDIKKIHDSFAKIRHGALIRRQLEWEEYFRWEVEDLIAAVYYSENHEPLGYLFYWIENEIFHIKEMVYLTQEARHGIWNYISAHFSMINEVHGANYTNEPLAFLLEDSEIKEEIQPYIMARIVDFEAFIRKYPFQVKSPNNKLTFRIEDPLLEWNNGNFSITWDENENLILTKEIISKPIKLNIGTLTTMLMSYKRPSYLSRVEKVETDFETIKILERLIPLEQVYFSDYF